MRAPIAVCIWFGCCLVAVADTPLLAVRDGRQPNDTGSGGETKFKHVNHPQFEGKVLQVVFADGDSFGNNGSEPSDWSSAVAVRFDMFNPGTKAIPLHFNIKHRKSTSYQTRVDQEFVLKPGKQSFRFPLADLVNVNGAAPDLSSVSHWFFNVEEGLAPTLLLSDVILETGGPPPGPPVVAIPGLPALPGGVEGFRITGTIGGQTVDLIATPLRGPVGGPSPVGGGPVPVGPAGPRGPVAVDPARTARIKAAKMPTITAPIEFNTPQADAVLSALEIFPPDNPLNQVVADWPLHPRSKAITTTIGLDKPLRYNPDMSFILVPPTFKKTDVKLTEFAEESDPGPYPVPENTPIEGWPSLFQRTPELRSLSLLDVQRDKTNQEGDRHALVVDPVSRTLVEFYQLKRVGGGWQAAGAALFDLKSNQLRPDGWTSADAAGLPIFPLTVRYDELQRGEIEHAMRVTVVRSRKAYIAPATHYASSLTDEDLPRMGERLRLRKDFDTSGFSPEVRTILNGLKKYGMLVADNGIEWAISVTPDPRIPVLHDELRKVKGSDFEVVLAP